MGTELAKWNDIRSIAITQREDLPKVKPSLALAEAAIKTLKSRGDFAALFEISEWQARLKRQAGAFVDGMEKQKPGEYQRYHDDTVAVSYSSLGFTKQDARRWRLHALIPEPEFLIYRDKRQKELKPLAQHDLLEIGKRIEREQKRQEAEIAGLQLDERILVGCFQDEGAKISNDSVHLILTDPPYSWKDAELEQLAGFAQEKLMEGGAFVCYIGHTQLPSALDAFRKHLRYWWIIACLHAGSAALMQRYGVRATWKPILMFVKKTRHDTSRIFLDRVSGGMEKEIESSIEGIKWKQAEAEAEYLIEYLCPQNGLVVDPCLGSGTTVAAAEKLQRRWIGIEKDRSTAKLASERLNKCH